MRNAVVAVAVALLLAGCGGSSSSPSSSSDAAAAPIVDVDGIEPIRAQFNADRGSPRLLLILSPT